MEYINNFIYEEFINPIVKKKRTMSKERFGRLFLKTGDNIIRLYRTLEMNNNCPKYELPITMHERGYIVYDEKLMYDEFLDRYQSKISKLPYDDTIALEFYDFYENINSNIMLYPIFLARTNNADKFVYSEIKRSMKENDIKDEDTFEFTIPDFINYYFMLKKI